MQVPSDAIKKSVHTYYGTAVTHTGHGSPLGGGDGAMVVGKLTICAYFR